MSDFDNLKSELYTCIDGYSNIILGYKEDVYKRVENKVIYTFLSVAPILCMPTPKGIKYYKDTNNHIEIKLHYKMRNSSYASEEEISRYKRGGLLMCILSKDSTKVILIEDLDYLHRAYSSNDNSGSRYLLDKFNIYNLVYPYNDGKPLVYCYNYNTDNLLEYANINEYYRRKYQKIKSILPFIGYSFDMIPRCENNDGKGFTHVICLEGFALKYTNVFSKIG